MQNHPGYRFCHDIVGEVSRTFAIGIDRLDSPASSYICASYLLCRIPDTIEDDNRLESDRKTGLLEEFKSLLEEPAADPVPFLESVESLSLSGTAWDLVQNTDRVLGFWNSFPGAIRRGIQPWILELIDGMKDFIVRHNNRIRIRDFEEFQQYCYYVAGTVGRLLTFVFSRLHDLSSTQRNELESRAVDFGESLQTVNIIKDVYVDYHEEGTIYLPERQLRAAGGDHASLFDNESATLQVIDDLIDHAWDKLESARQYIQTLPEECRAAREFCIVPYLLAVCTLRYATNHRSYVLRSRDVKIDRGEVHSILANLDRCVDSDHQLDILARRARNKPLTETVSG